MVTHSRRSHVTTSIPPVWGQSSPGLQLHNVTKFISVTLSSADLRRHKKKTLGVNYTDDTMDSLVSRARTGRRCGAEAVRWRQQHPLQCPEDQEDGCGFSCPSTWLEQLWNPADLRQRRLQRLLWTEDCQQMQPTASRRVVPHQMQGQNHQRPPSQQPPYPQTGRCSALWKEMVKSCTSTTLMFRDVADRPHRTMLNLRVWKGLHAAFIAFEEQKNIVFAEPSKGNTTESKSAGPPAGARQEFAPPIPRKLAGWLSRAESWGAGGRSWDNPPWEEEWDREREVTVHSSTGTSPFEGN